MTPVQSDNGNIIEVIDLQKSYGPLRAVDGVSFTVAAGEVFGILGPNGAGKTTTVEILEGMTREHRAFGFAPTFYIGLT